MIELKRYRGNGDGSENTEHDSKRNGVKTTKQKTGIRNIGNAQHKTV